jgi:glyoxylase-like metal-dependent hydrolase (beta-lactamase superfamily II)/rhodanese-related sulfurtransferase
MKVEQIYTGCLAEAAYYIHSEGEGVIIDPLRETSPYLERLKKDGVTLKYIFLTHFHADFVSGHIDLAEKTGATIVFGPTAKANFSFHEAEHGEIFRIGKVSFEWLHTPGHTMESSTMLLKDENGKPHSIYTGDTLFIGDVGRPDLAVKQGELTEEDLARHLFDSLRNKIMTLPDDVIVYPGHGAGSACGKKMSKETFDSLGNQKANNYALRSDMSQDEFVKEVLTGLTAPPQYFPKNAMMNKGINDSIDEILNRGTEPLTVEAFKGLAESGALMLDVRSESEFVKSHIPGSIFIGLDGSFAPWVGALIRDIDQKIILITPEGREEEAVTRLSRIGYDYSIGYLKGGIEAWKLAGNEVDSIQTITPEQFEQKLAVESLPVLDVRKKSEFDSEHLIGAVNEPLDTINSRMNEIDTDKTFYIHCAGGYRSVIFESILKSRGIHNFVDILGGFAKLKSNTNLACSEYVCPSTLL